ncbi:MAG: hypothetical protein ABJL98_11530 [Lentilitoribacter sp.]
MKKKDRVLYLSPSGDKAVGTLEVCALTAIRLFNSKVAMVAIIAFASFFGALNSEVVIVLLNQLF